MRIEFSKFAILNADEFELKNSNSTLIIDKKDMIHDHKLEVKKNSHTK